MSDQEINKLVYLKVKPEREAYKDCRVGNYCEYPSDAWPIILENKILFKKPSNLSKPVARLEKGRLLVIKKCENKCYGCDGSRLQCYLYDMTDVQIYEFSLQFPLFSLLIHQE